MSDTGSLLYGSLDFSASGGGPFYALSEGFTAGAPVTLTQALPRLLLDGEDVAGDRSSNREITFTVEIEAGDAIALAEAEAQLIAEVTKPRNALTWTPPNLGVPTVFDTFRGSARQVFNDLDEVMCCKRTFEVTIAALPFGHSVDEVVEAGLTTAATPVTTLVDACDSATGWTGSGALSVDTSVYATPTGALRQYPSASGGHYSATFARTGGIDLTGTPYVTVQVYDLDPSTGSHNVNVAMWADGVKLTPVGSSAGSAFGWNRYRFFCSDTSVSALRVVVSGGADGGSAVTRIDDLNKTNQLSTGGTARESLRSIPVRGSVRTPGALAIHHDTSALGDVLVYTSDDLGSGYRPDLRRWRTAGGTVTADANLISGSSEPISNSGASPTTWLIPATNLPPGPYVLMARLKDSAGGSYVLTSAAQTKMGTNAVGTAQQVTTRTAIGTGYSIVPLGVLHLPPVAVPIGTGAAVQVTLLAPTGATITLDEAWLFHLDGVLTQVACGTTTPAAGGSSSRLWIDYPSVDQPAGGIWVGTQADRSDARSAGPDLAAFGQHAYAPPQTLAFVVTSNALAPAVDLAYLPRWHTNAAS